jgi:hypothetical protein
MLSTRSIGRLVLIHMIGVVVIQDVSDGHIYEEGAAIFS